MSRPVYGFTLSTNDGESLHPDGGMKPHPMSRPEMGTIVHMLRLRASIIDPMTEIARDGARRMLIAALKAEADGFVATFSEDLLADGRQRIVRPDRSARGRAEPGDPDGDRADRGPSAEGARSGDGCARRGGDPVHGQHLAEMGAAVEESRCPAAGALAARRLHRRFPGGAVGPAGGAGAEPVAWRDRAAHGRLAAGVRPLAGP